MKHINKQKFLAELAKLLTFMYEEDRQKALAMYSKMFEDAENEQALLQTLISPTRQAVVVARAYDAKERRLQVTSTSRDEGGHDKASGAAPEYMLAIQKVYEAYARQNGSRAAKSDNQFSLFEDESHANDALFEETFPEVLEPEPEHVPRHAAPAVPAQAVDLEEAGEEPEAFEPLPEEEPELVPIQAEEAVREEDKVDAFLADFSLEELEDPEAPEAEEPAEPEDETGKVEEAPVASPAPAEEPAEPVISGRPADLSAILGEETEKPQAMVRKSKPALLVLFILLFVPITLAGILLLLIPTLLCLALAVGVIAAGAATLIAAFGSGLTPMANILVVFGLAVIVLALGLLFLWLFIWFIGGPIVGLVRGVMTLGGKWCYKEVAE